jgi:hypothetical protein
LTGVTLVFRGVTVSILVLGVILDIGGTRVAGVISDSEFFGGRDLDVGRVGIRTSAISLGIGYSGDLDAPRVLATNGVTPGHTGRKATGQYQQHETNLQWHAYFDH